MKLPQPKLDILKESKEPTDKRSHSRGDPDSDDNNNVEENEENCKPSFFGVRSYIHHFYEPVAANDGSKSDSEETDEARYLIAPKKNKRGSGLWKYSFWFGIILLCCGVSALLFGYIHPKIPENIGKKIELKIEDFNAKEYNIKLKQIKVFGLVTFCAGGSLVAFTLILASLVGLSWIDEEDGEDSEPIKVMLPSAENFANEDSKVPATEKVTNVQPSRQDESVITESGLTKMK